MDAPDFKSGIWPFFVNPAPAKISAGFAEFEY